MYSVLHTISLILEAEVCVHVSTLSTLPQVVSVATYFDMSCLCHFYKHSNASSHLMHRPAVPSKQKRCSTVRGRIDCRLDNEVISKLEKDYGCNVVSVWCNLFEDGDHHIDWHQDQYGCHTFVLSFGSPRKVLYRKKRGLLSSEKILAEHTTTNGDMYYFSPVWDKKTEHCVPKMKESVGPRISLVFFVSRPFTSNKWGTVLRLLAS